MSRELSRFFIKDAIDVHRILDELNQKLEGSSGAVTIFQGVVRGDASGDTRVREIDYSAYLPMATESFAQIESSISKEYSLHKLVVLHSIGKVEAGQCSLLVYVSAAHRAEAFDALREVVEQIKAKVPIWKKEIFSDDSSSWGGV